MKRKLLLKDINNDIFIDLLVSKKHRFFRHVVMVTSLVFCMLNSKFASDNLAGRHNYVAILSYILLLLIFYFNMYVLVPHLLYKNRLLQYVLGLFLCSAILYVEQVIFDPTTYDIIRIEPNLETMTAWISSITLLFPFVLSSTSLKLFQRWIINERDLSELKQKSLENELQALRNQINPHFLFNMLNSVHVLIDVSPKKAAQVVLKLSDCLRYQLYEASNDRVLMTSEIRFIGDLLKLEKVRRDDFTFTINTDYGSEEPLWIISHTLGTFVENAIKHSQSPGEHSYVHISVQSSSTKFKFTCCNSKPKIVKNHGRTDAGLGLENALKRLQLVYGDSFSHRILDDEKSYKIQISINLT